MIILFLFFFWSIPKDGNSAPLQWKRGALTTGPPGKSPLPQDSHTLNPGWVLGHLPSIPGIWLLLGS